MKKTVKLFLLVFCISMLLIVTNNVSAYGQESATSEDPVRILYISSYSYSWGSVPFQIKGLVEALPDNYVVNYEFMDTKNTVYSDGYKEFYDLLKYKLSSRESYDGVIVCDDAALKFVQLYKDELFPDMPIAFEGIDNIENGIEAAKDPNITGIVEEVDYATNMKLASHLFPNAKKLVLILDNMENGVGIAKQLKAADESFQDYEVTYINSSNYTKDELCSILNELDDSSIVFCISMGQSQNGYVYSEEERYAIIRDYTHVPMFRFTQSGVGNGLLGGYIVDHEACTKIAVQLLVQMMEEHTTSDIVLDTPSKYYFDYNVMKAYGIKPSDIAQNEQDNITIINEPESFLMEYAAEIVAALGMLLASIIFIAFLYMVHNSRKQKELIEKANVANQAKSDFLSHMSHDLRTPLNGIIGSAALVQDESTTKEEKLDYIQTIDVSGHYMLNLINDILDMSQLEKGKMELQEVSCKESSICRDARVLFEPLCQEKNIAFLVEDTLCDESIIIDKKRFQQIVYNLLSNAIKYTPEGGMVKLKLESSKKDKENRELRVFVEDNGIGMSEEFQKHMYDTFAQEKDSLQDKRISSGLGLSIVKELVLLMNGTIECDSTPNKGTTFTVMINAQKASEKNLPEINTANVPNQSKEIWDFTGKHILVCEDNDINAKIISTLLEKAGCIVDIAENGKVGVELFEVSKEHYYDAVLMDIRMPVMDGLEAAKRIRHSGHTDGQTIIIIAISANAYAEDKNASMNAGMNAHLTKPIERNELFQLLKELLETNII